MFETFNMWMHFKLKHCEVLSNFALPTPFHTRSTAKHDYVSESYIIGRQWVPTTVVVASLLFPIWHPSLNPRVEL